MNVISFFAGCGGLDLGFRQAGFDVVWANEYDSSIHPTYRYNHPKTQLNTSDIRYLKLSDIPDSDGIIGGPPCQSWSVGGKSLGVDDDRGMLVYDYIRIVKEKKPKFFVMENVPGMVTPKHIEVFNQFLELFRNARYKVKYELLNASDFNVPQDRLRVFIVGIRSDINVEYLFPNKLDLKPMNLFQAIGDIKLPPIPYYTESVEANKSTILNHDYYIGPFDQKFMARNRVRGWDELSFTIQAQAKNEPLHPQAPKMEFISYDKRRFVVGKENLYRRLSVRECARIQSFPDTFRFIYNDILDGYKMVGNAVPPQLAYHIALSINSCLSSLHFNPQRNMVLVGYVKRDSDFPIIKRVNIYYVRGGNRPGALQYGQLYEPIRWLLLHRKEKIELYELKTGKAEKCNSEYLRELGFNPHGDEYWAFRIKRKEENTELISHIIKSVKVLRLYPQFVWVNSTSFDSKINL